MRVYLAGPMTGIPDFNFPAFFAAAEHIRGLGYECVNPAENVKGDTSQPWEFYLRMDLRHLLDCDAVAILPGGENSRGMNLELIVAHELGMPVWYAWAMTGDEAVMPLTTETTKAAG